MKIKHIIITALTAMAAMVLLIAIQTVVQIKQNKAPDTINEDGEIPQVNRGVEPEVLGVKIGMSLGEVLKIPAIANSTEILYGDNDKEASISELTSLYEAAKAKLNPEINDVESVQKFVNRPHTGYSFTPTGEAQFVGFPITYIRPYGCDWHLPGILRSS